MPYGSPLPHFAPKTALSISDKALYNDYRVSEICVEMKLVAILLSGDAGGSGGIKQVD